VVSGQSVRTSADNGTKPTKQRDQAGEEIEHAGSCLEEDCCCIFIKAMDKIVHGEKLYGCIQIGACSYARNTFLFALM